MNNFDIDTVMAELEKHFTRVRTPVVDQIQIQTKDPFKVLVTTILSARTKDETTSQAAKNLFEKVKNIDDLEKISAEELDSIIHQVGFHPHHLVISIYLQAAGV